MPWTLRHHIRKSIFTYEPHYLEHYFTLALCLALVPTAYNTMYK